MSGRGMSDGIRSDRGVAVVWSLTLVSVLGLVAFVGAALGGVVAARQRVAAVADLAALAGAQAPSDPCGHAAAAAGANAMTVRGCRLDGADVVVDVQGPAPPIVSRLFAFLGGESVPLIGVSARAGPPAA